MNIRTFKTAAILVAACTLTAACGVQKSMNAVQDMNEKTNHLSDQTDAVANGVRKQSMLIPLEHLMDSSNYDELSPVPAKLMPWGQQLADVINAQEMVELSYLWLKEIDEVTPPPDQDAAGNDLPYTTAQIQNINRNKLGRLYALMSIVGFLPETVVTQMIQTQIVGYGRYEETAFQVLMLRAQFLNDVLLDGSLLSKPLGTVGALQLAVKYADSLERIARLPFIEKIHLKTLGFLKPMDQLEFVMTTSLAINTWNKISLSAKSDISLVPDDVTGDKGLDLARSNQMRSDFNQSMLTVAKRINDWGKVKKAP